MTTADRTVPAGSAPLDAGAPRGAGAARPPWPADQVCAFLDVGTNSVRLLLVRISPQRTYTILSQQKETVRLGEGGFVDHQLRPEAMRRAALVCRKFAEMARAYGADDIVAVATAATREARNQREFVRIVQDEAGIDLHIISGVEEARLIHQGVSSAVRLGDRRALFIDVGGGSTELILGGQDHHVLIDSLKLGAIRLTSLFFLPDETGPVAADRFALIQAHVRNVAIRSIQRFREAPVDLAIGSSGTIENLADIAVRLIHRRARARDDEITRTQLRDVVGLLCAAPLEQRRQLPGINPARADIIIAGSAIVLTLMEDLGIERLRISDRGLREGLIVDYLARRHPDMFGDLSVRERSVRRLGRACGYDEAHARTVARLATALFDGAAAIGLHGYGPHERELLAHAAMLHDIGVFVSYDNHHAHTAYLIRNADLLGFDATEIAVIALVARFHRKGVPSRKAHPDFAALDRPARRMVRRLSPLLRLAENLDRSHGGLVADVSFERIDGRTVALVVGSDHDCQLELWGVQAGRRLFEKTYGVRLTVRPAPSDASPEPGVLPDPG